MMKVDDVKHQDAWNAIVSAVKMLTSKVNAKLINPSAAANRIRIQLNRLDIYLYWSLQNNNQIAMCVCLWKTASWYSCLTILLKKIICTPVEIFKRFTSVVGLSGFGFERQTLESKV